MPRGSRPGERRGGRQKGTKNKRTVEAELLAQRMLEGAPPRTIQNARLGKDTLEKFMTLFDALAEHYRPIPESPHSDEVKFTKYGMTLTRSSEERKTESEMRGWLTIACSQRSRLEAKR